MAIDFYFAGTQCIESEYLLRDLNANILKSYVNDQKEIQRWFEYKRQGWKGKLMIDNGEFTFHRQGGSLDIDEYIDWLNQNDEFYDYAIALDSIPGVWGQPRTVEQVRESAKKTFENYVYMVDKVKSPSKLLPVFHQGEPLTNLENFLEMDDIEYMCISGSKDASSVQRDRWFQACYDVIRKSSHPDIKIHFLGIAQFSNAIRFPITSMDATSWIMTGAMGGVMTDYGVVYVGDECKSLNHMPEQAAETVRNLCDQYGVTLEGIGSDYKQRMLFNIHYIYNKAKSVEYKHQDLMQRRLF